MADKTMGILLHCMGILLHCTHGKTPFGLLLLYKLGQVTSLIYHTIHNLVGEILANLVWIFLLNFSQLYGESSKTKAFIKILFFECLCQIKLSISYDTENGSLTASFSAAGYIAHCNIDTTMIYMWLCMS